MTIFTTWRAMQQSCKLDWLGNFGSVWWRFKCRRRYKASNWILYPLGYFSRSIWLHVDGNALSDIVGLPTICNWVWSVDGKLWWSNNEVSCNSMVRWIQWRMCYMIPIHFDEISIKLMNVILEFANIYLYHKKFFVLVFYFFCPCLILQVLNIHFIEYYHISTTLLFCDRLYESIR